MKFMILISGNVEGCKSMNSDSFSAAARGSCAPD